MGNRFGIYKPEKMTSEIALKRHFYPSWSDIYLSNFYVYILPDLIKDFSFSIDESSSERIEDESSFGDITLSSFEKYCSFDTAWEFDIDIRLCQSWDDTIEREISFVRHVLTHIEIVYCSWDFFCFAFFFWKTHSPFFHVFLIDRRILRQFAMEIFLYHTMKKKVWIATNRGSEVCIVFECEPKMSIDSIFIDSFCHLREKKSREAIEVIIFSSLF